MFIFVLFILFLSVILRIFTKQILVKQFGMDNILTEIILFDADLVRNDDLVGEKEENSEVNVNIDWTRKYPFNEEQLQSNVSNVTFSDNTVMRAIDQVKNNIDFYTSNFLPGYTKIIKLCQYYKIDINWNLMSKSDDTLYVLYMENGYLTYSEPMLTNCQINEIADSVGDFNRFLKDNGIDYYYINVGSKVDPDNKCLDSDVLYMEHTNENADRLLSALESRNVNIVDMRELIKQDGLNWYEAYYITDQHWTNRTGLWAASKIANILNRDSGFKYNLDLFDENAYNIEPFYDFWYGRQATYVGLAGCYREEFDTILPNYETSFIVDIPTKAYHAEGDYFDAIFKEQLFNEIKGYSDEDFIGKEGPYCAIEWTNDALGTIVNKKMSNNSDKKILIIQDSYGWYTSSFLACDTGEVDLMYPSRFDGSIREYIRQTKPDVVITLYSEGNIGPIELETHQNFFDLR